MGEVSYIVVIVRKLVWLLVPSRRRKLLGLAVVITSTPAATASWMAQLPTLETSTPD